MLFRQLSGHGPAVVAGTIVDDNEFQTNADPRQLKATPYTGAQRLFLIITWNDERERESLTYQTNTSNADSFSLISYIYRKIPEPGPNRFYRLSSLVAYPFSYPFFANRLLFPQEYTVVIENKNFSEKISLFSDVFLFVLRTELLLTMCPTWSAGVFFIYDHILLSSLPDALPRIRAPPLAAPYSGQMPEASPGVALAVMRDAHVLNSSSTRLKRTFH